MLGSKADEQLLIEPISGWRAWSVVSERCLNQTTGIAVTGGVRDLKDLTFISPSMRTAWKAGQLTWDLKCWCSVGRKRRIDHLRGAMWQLLAAQPNPTGCHCGINAFDTRERLLESQYVGHHAVGRVELSGQVRQYNMGWRAERAKVVEVWATTPAYDEAVRAAAQSCGATYHGVLPERDELISKSQRLKARERASEQLSGSLLAVAAVGMAVAAVQGSLWLWAVCLVLGLASMRLGGYSALAQDSTTEPGVVEHGCRQEAVTVINTVLLACGLAGSVLICLARIKHWL